MLTHADVTQGGQAARLELLFSPVSFREPYTLHYAEHTETAFWQPPARPGDPHRICVGGRNECGDADKAPQLAQSLVWHELGHALYTSPDLVAINQVLADAKIPFGVFNLFEDARIEQRFRDETGLQFEWLTFETLAGLASMGPQAPLAAGVLFFRLIQLEGDRKAYFSELRDAQLASGVDPQVVLDFWQRTVECEATRDVIPVVRDWLDAFPEESQRESPKADGLGATLQGLASGFEPQFKGSQPVQDDAKNPGGAGQAEAAGGKSFPNAVKVADVESGDLGAFVSKGFQTYALEPLVIARLTQALRRGLSTGQRTGYSHDPGKRMRAERLAIGKAPFRRLTSERGCRGIRKVAVLLDCSGSMEEAAANGIQLVAALSELARNGEVSGKAVFSKVEDDRAIHLTLPLPVPADVLTRLMVDGEAEGLEAALRANRAGLAGHTVFVFSDGHIGDDAIQPESLQGMAVMGLYCGNPENNNRQYCEDALREYFRVTVARDSMEDLALAVASELRRM